MVFANRAEAARLLGRRLAKYRGRHPLVLAIPRGAVPMGKIVAEALDGELDVVLVHKLRAPYNPELAMGSIDEAGHVCLDRETRGLWHDPYIELEKVAQLTTLQRRRRLYSAAGAPIDVAGRIVIVIDDGLATGSTMLAALRAVRARHPATLVAAAPVASAHAAESIAEYADDVICLEMPDNLLAIGYYFRDFSQVSDDQVVAALQEVRRPLTSAERTT
jgi:putative phosphoribosyl transferase